LLAVAAALALGAVSIGVEALARARLDASLQAGTTRFFARPPILQVGTRVDPAALRRYLDRLGYRRLNGRRVTPGEYHEDGGRWSIGRRAFRVADRLDPGGVVTAELDDQAWVTGLEDGQGGSLTLVVLPPEQLRPPGPPGEDRAPVHLDDVPPSLTAAVLAVEDRHFYQHHGVDLGRVLGAAWANVRAVNVVEGGSTITQQLAKNLFLSPRRSPLRKLRELAMTLVLEMRHTKRQILEAYLNEVYLGQDGAYELRGMGSGAQFYFGKDVSQLSLPEAALLAGLIRGPNIYSPLRHPEAAVNRRNLVLGLMRQQGKISDGEYRRAAGTALRVRRALPPARAGRYFTDFVAAGLEGQPDLTVFTTLDMDIQLAAEAAVRDGVASLESEHPGLLREENPLQAALVAVDPATGDILAMVGGRRYGVTQFNRAADARRQPGSAFKPVVALAALSGRDVTLATLLQDEPLSVETPAGLWQPVDYDSAFRGPVTLRHALELSLNVPFARLGMQLGAGRIIETARKLGFKSPLREVPSLALGSSEVTPLEMAGAFGVLAAQGFRADLHAVEGILDRDGHLVTHTEHGGEQVFAPEETYLVTSALEGAVERGTGRGLRAWGYSGPVAAKSGTTNDYRDAWFVGYTPQLAVAVWVGFDDGQSVGLVGSQAAMPIFARFLNATQARSGGQDFEPPADLEMVSVDPLTGFAADESCGGEPEYFLPGTSPPEGEGCWGVPGVPGWIANAEAKVTSRVRSLLEELRRRIGRVFR
jgi:penicillin-binding protein 1B